MNLNTKPQVFTWNRENVPHKFLAALNGRVYAAIPFCFAAIFLLSGIYEIPFVAVDTASITESKNVIFVCFMVLMASCLQWREAVRSPFSLFCGVWALLHVVHWAFRMEAGDAYLHRLVQIVFIWIFVNTVIQRKETSDRFLGLRSFFFVSFFSVACLLLTLLAFYPEFTRVISNGLGNNRVNFSIWLSQLVFLVLLTSLGKPEQSALKAMAWVTPILVLQTFTGGRTGLAASLAICLFFFHRQGGIRLSIVSGLYLAFLVSLSAALSPLPDIYPGTSIFRTLWTPAENGMFAWLDQLTSYRIGILVSALSSLDAESALLGNGALNFKGWAMGYPWEVHNIYARAVGEMGLAGLSALLGLLVLPFRVKAGSADTTAAKFYCGVFLMIGMVHPDLLTTAISTCMIFWLGYAEILRGQKSGSG